MWEGAFIGLLLILASQHGLKDRVHMMQQIRQGNFKLLFLCFILVGISACGEPFYYFAGGRLGGEEAPLVELPTSGGVFQLETLPADPYSVNIGFILLDGAMYIDPAEDREWYQNILLNPAVRIRFDGGDLIHPMSAVRETDPMVLARLDPERIILRLEPR